MKNIKIIVKKELLRIFKDPKLIVMLFIMPGLMLYILYSFMGQAFTRIDNHGEGEIVNIYHINMPLDIETMINMEEFEVNGEMISITLDELNDTKDKLLTNEADIILVFEDDFLNKVDSQSKPSLSIYYNPTDNKSNSAYNKIYTIVNIFKSNKQIELFNDIEIYNESVEAIYDEKKASGMGFALMVPFLILTFLFSGCMSVAPESIAGEKERGTLATILITPIKRTELALGKIISLSMLATMSAVSSFIGLMLSFPKLMAAEDVNTNIYSVADYAMILLILISTVLFIIGLMSILSSFASSVKEANMMLMPFMGITMLIGLSSFFSINIPTNTLLYVIPVYNSVQGLSSVLSFNVNIMHLITIVISNAVYIAIFVYLLSRLFNNEKVMFSK